MNEDLLNSQAFITNAIAQVAVIVASGNTYKDPKVIDFDPVAQIEKRTEARSLIEPKTAQLFLELTKQGQIPSWVLSEIDVEFIKLAV